MNAEQSPESPTESKQDPSVKDLHERAHEQLAEIHDLLYGLELTLCSLVQAGANPIGDPTGIKTGMR